MTTPEGKVKDAIKKLLKSYGTKVYYVMPATWGYGKSGAPDFVICAAGRFLSVEAKSATGKPTPLQVIAMDSIREAGGSAYIVKDEPSLAALKSFLDFATKG